MLFSNLRLTLSIAYVGLLLWRSRVAAGLPSDWWAYVATFGVMNFTLFIAEHVHAWWYQRRIIQTIRGMSPEQRALWARRFRSSSAYQRLLHSALDEGSITIGDGVRRYPFARGVRRAFEAAFYFVVSLGVLVLAVDIAFGIAASPSLGWVLFSVAVVCAVVAAILRGRLAYMESMIEISDFAIAHVRGNHRKVIRWSEPLLLRARPAWRRLELLAPGSGQIIYLDYDRIGIREVVALVMDRGGFRHLLAEPSDEN